MFEFILKEQPMRFFQDVRPQQNLHYNYLNLILLFIVILMTIAMIIYFLIKIRNIRKSRFIEEELFIIMTFEELLIEPLKKLVSLDLTVQKVEFYILLNYIFRLCLEKKMEIPALEQTTREIISSMKKQGLFWDDIEYMRKFLNRSDLVKFYNLRPELSEMLFDRGKILEIVKSRTKDLSVFQELFKKAGLE